MKTRLLILIPTVITLVIVGFMTYLDYSKLTAPINGIPQEGSVMNPQILFVLKGH